MQYLLEETGLPKQANEPETPEPQPNTAEHTSTPEPEVGAPETGEQEQTALVPTEPEVIEGEVVELELKVHPEASTPPKQKPYWVLIPFAIVLCLLFLAGSYLLPLFTPTATVTIIPVEQTIITTAAIRVHARVLPALTLSQSQTVPATGKRHQNATRAVGTITFYNGLLSSQTIAAGTILTGADGVQVITDQSAPIPAANPPIEGRVTVSAHAIATGASGNIPAYDINQACCATSVLAKNTAAFTGGAEARDDAIVTRQDINTVVTSLLSTLYQSENAALHVQLQPGEALLPTSCTPHVSPNHKMGDEVREIRVTVSLTCAGIAIASHDVEQQAMQMETMASVNRFGTGYIPLGDTHVTITRATITNQAQGMATVTVNIAATVVYHITPGEKDMSEYRPHFSPEPARAENSIVHVSLEHVLPLWEVLAVHRELGIAAVLTSDGERPRMRAAQMFPPMEMAMLLPLVFSYPDYAPNELLLASFSGGTTEKDIEQARNQLLRAKERGEWDLMMRPMRNSLSRVRQKIITLHFDVRSLFETGVRSVLSKLHNRG